MFFHGVPNDATFKSWSLMMIKKPAKVMKFTPSQEMVKTQQLQQQKWETRLTKRMFEIMLFGIVSPRTKRSTLLGFWNRFLFLLLNKESASTQNQTIDSIHEYQFRKDDRSSPKLTSNMKVAPSIKKNRPSQYFFGCRRQQRERVHPAIRPHFSVSGHRHRMFLRGLRIHLCCPFSCCTYPKKQVFLNEKSLKQKFVPQHNFCFFGTNFI